jgi:anti-anti-sigma factor
MSEVKFVSSACLGALITLLQDLEHVRGKLVLACCRPDVAFLFKTTKLDMVIPLFDDVDEAKDEL